MTKFISVTKGCDFNGQAEGPGYIRADKIVSVFAFLHETDVRTPTGDYEKRTQSGTMIIYGGDVTEEHSMFVTEDPHEVFKRLNVVLDSARDHQVQAWIDTLVNNFPAIEGAIAGLKNRD